MDENRQTNSMNLEDWQFVTLLEGSVWSEIKGGQNGPICQIKIIAFKMWFNLDPLLKEVYP